MHGYFRKYVIGGVIYVNDLSLYYQLYFVLRLRGYSVGLQAWSYMNQQQLSNSNNSSERRPKVA